VFEAGGVPPLVRLLALQPPQPITEKAAWALSNLTAGSSPSQEEFCALGGLEVVALLLRQFTGASCPTHTSPPYQPTPVPTSAFCCFHRRCRSSHALNRSELEWSGVE